VIVPHLLDQPIWGEYVRALGCASAVIPRSALTADRLGVAIGKALSGSRYRRSATRMGQRIRAEKGVQVARQLIEQLVL
jgi:UDP:flavonoid glycosyltransferase YjiC (YdhE family)